MKISNQISDLVKPLENLYSNNVSSMGMVNTSQSKMVQLLSNSAVCLGQISTIFQQHFVQTKVLFQNKTQQLLYNIRKTQKVGVIDGRIVINKNQNIASSIISLCETMVNNLSRWITTNSKIFRESPFGQLSSQNRRKGDLIPKLGTAESKRCVYCQQIMEAVKIKSIKQSILDNTSAISGMQSILHLVKNQREQQCSKNGKLFSGQQDLSLQIINLLRKCDFFQSQDDGKDFLNSDFWERIQVNNYQKEKDKYYAKTSPFLNNWFEQEKLKDRTYTQNKIEPQQFSHPSKIDIKMVDGLISTMLKLFKQHFGKKQIMIKFKNFISSLNLQQSQLVTLTNKQSKSQNKKIECKLSCQCPCQLKKEQIINSPTQKQKIKSKTCQSVIELGKSSNFKKQQFEKQRLLEKDHKHTNVKQMKKQDDQNNNSYKSSKSDNSSELLDTVNQKQQCAKQISASSNQNQLAVNKSNNEKETKQRVSKIERNSKCESQRENQDLKKQSHGQRRKIRASQSQIQLFKKKNNNQRASSRFRESVFKSMIKKSRQFSISSIQMKNMVEKGIQCNFEAEAHLLQKHSSEKQSGAKTLNTRQNSSVDQFSIYSKQLQKSKLIQKQETRATEKLKNNAKMGVSNRKRAAKTHTNEQIDTCLQQNQKWMQRTSSTLKDEMRNTQKNHKTRVSMLDDITNRLPLIQVKTSKKLRQQTQQKQPQTTKQQNQTTQISSIQIQSKQKIKKRYRTILTDQNQVKNKNICNSNFEHKNKIQQLASHINLENKNKNKNKKNDDQQYICIQAVNKISKNQIYQSMFSMVDLQLFGGLSCSKKPNRVLENADLSQSQKIMSQLMFKHICQLSSYRNSLYQTVISFLCHPYETIENGTIIKSETNKKQLQNMIQYLLGFHKKKCNSIDCEHIIRFKNKIMFQFL